MNGLGDCLVILNVDGAEADDQEALRAAAVKCTKLREIVWNNHGREGTKSLRCILPQVRGSVRTLKVEFAWWHSNGYNDATCDIDAELSNLNYYLRKSTRLFHGVGQACNFLEKVDILFRAEQGPEIHIQQVKNLVQSFSCCPSLKEFYVGAADLYHAAELAPDDVQKVLLECFSQSKVRCVSVLGHRYLPCSRLE